MAAVIPFLELRPAERSGAIRQLDGFGEVLVDDAAEDAAIIATIESASQAEEAKREGRRPKAQKRQLTEAEVAARKKAAKAKAKEKSTIDVDGSKIPTLAKPHAELTRLLWTRKVIIEELQKRKFVVEIIGGQVKVRVTPELDAEIVPWHKIGGDKLERFSLFSTNSKMGCPTFDLPAGHMLLGGACPGAIGAQSTVPGIERQLLKGEDQGASVGVMKDGKLSLRVTGQPLSLERSVCTYCYATGGKYSEVVVQFAELARYAFVQSMMREDPVLNADGSVMKEKGTDGVERVVTKRAALKRLIVYTLTQKTKFYADEQNDKSVGKYFVKGPDGKDYPLKPVRVHSSGDFYNIDYARLWIEIAWELYQIDPGIRLWAPTRTQVVPRFVDFWRDEANVPPNFMIRPSSYFAGDPAPAPLNPNMGAGPGNAKGTSVLDEDTARAHMVANPINPKEINYGDGELFDFQCGVYALEEGDLKCGSSVGPDGKVGCRACWMRPDMSVNYVIH